MANYVLDYSGADVDALLDSINPLTRAQIISIIENLYPSATSSEIENMADGILADYSTVTEDMIETILLGGAETSIYASIDSPAFTGTPTAPTPNSETNNTQIATTAFVKTALSGKENTSNKVTSLSSNSTDTQYPSAKLLYNQLALKVDASSLGNAKIYQGTCSTAADVTQKDVVCSAYTRTGDPVKGDIIFVTFDNTNEAAVGDLTLKVGNSTAKNIKYQGTTTIVNIPAVGYLIEDMTYRFQYNGEFWVVMLNYDSNTNTLQRIYASSANVEFPLAGQVNGTTTTAPLAITSSNKACYGAVPNTAANKATINASTGKITVPSGLNLGTSSSKLGNIVFRNATNAYTTTINSGAPTANKTITLPTETGTLALLASPAFTGTPTAPTAAAGTNTTQIATTAFVQSAISTLLSELDGNGVSY